jgi:hypothetical protein
MAITAGCSLLMCSFDVTNGAHFASIQTNVLLLCILARLCIRASMAFETEEPLIKKCTNMHLPVEFIMQSVMKSFWLMVFVVLSMIRLSRVS